MVYDEEYDVGDIIPMYVSLPNCFVQNKANKVMYVDCVRVMLKVDSTNGM